MAERVRVDTLIDKRDSIALAETQRQLNLALANGVRVVERWHDAAPQPVKPGSAHDSVTQLTAQVKSCRDDGNTLAQSVLGIKSTCQAFRDSAATSLRDKDTRYAHLDSLYKIGKPPKRWGFGPYIGWGLANDGQTANIERRVSVGVSIHYSIISW